MTDFLARAIAYAQTRWSWEDDAFIEEMYEQDLGAGMTPEGWIDACAVKFDLIDPKTVGWM